MKLFRSSKMHEFLTYFTIGGISTVIDWSSFWFFSTPLKMHYQFSLILGYSIAAVFHYTANKFITFDCQSKKIGSQFSLYFLVTCTTLFCSIATMELFVSFLSFEKLYARMLTTILMLFPNYLLHKYITFNKKIFLQPR